MATAWLLIVSIVMPNGELHQYVDVYKDKESCEAAAEASPHDAYCAPDTPQG